MEPWLSWTLAIGIGSGLIYYYKGTGKPAPRAVSDPSASRRRQDKQQKQPNDATSDTAFSSSTDSPSTSKRKPQKQSQPAPKPRVAPAAPAPQQHTTEPADEADDDKAWAEQLSAAQKGVNLNSAAAKSKTSSGAKANKKKQRAEEVTGANDWPSDNAAPSQGHSASEPSSTNVTDMLEPAAPGPSVLRLTGEEKAKKQTAQKAEPEKETKKQRQNRRKAEEKKAAREQDEQERKALLESQRRTAREARGEPARNGVPAAAPAASAWLSAGGAKKENAGARPSSDGQLLDTFDHEALSATSSNEPQTNTTTPATTTSSLGAYDQSEEAQMEMIAQLNQNTGWNEVGKPKKGKKKASAPEATTVEPGVKEMPQFSSPATDELVNGGSKAPGLPTKSTTPSNAYDLLSYTADYAPGAGPRHPQDSDWAA